MQIKEYLNMVCEQIKYRPIRNEIYDELQNHIEEEKENYMQEGIEEKEAERKAIAQMGDAIEIGKSLNKIHKPILDWKLILIICISLCFGLIVAYTRASNYIFEGTQYDPITKYIIFVSLGLVCSCIVYFIDYKKISKYSNLIYAIASLLIIFAIYYGTQINGRANLDLKIAIVSPSVIVVPLYMLSFVGYLQNIKEERKLKIQFKEYKEININIDILKIMLLSLVSIFLLILVPSLTSAGILAITYLILVTIKLCKTKRKKYAVMLWIILIILMSLLFTFVCYSEPYRLSRIRDSFNPEIDPQGGGWVGINQKLIINSANLFGEADDMSNSLNLFDEGTNYAFISILAHYGWGLSLGIVIAIILLNLKLILNARKIKDLYGKLIIIGISSIFILQSVFNVLMNLNLGIQADFNIPLISYGGTSLVINMMSLALALSVYRRKNILIIK